VSRRAICFAPATLLLVFLGAALSIAAEEPWIDPAYPHRLRLQVDMVTPLAANSPVSVNLNIAGLLDQQGPEVPNGTFDIRIVRTAGSDQEALPVKELAVSESLRMTGLGQLSWLARYPKKTDYWAYIRRVNGASMGVPDREPVGIGDAFRYNRPNGFDPLGVGMTNDQPTVVDWDGDGVDDLLQRNIYSHSYGEPYWGLFYWRNIGTNDRPRFDRFVRVRADGEVLQEKYATYQFFDWNADGRVDVVAGTEDTERRALLKIYLQSNERDSAGLPVLTQGSSVPVEGGGRLWYGMRIVDWNSDGVAELFTLRSKVQYFPTPVVNYTWRRHTNEAEAGQSPSFGHGKPLRLAGNTVYPERPNDFHDWDGDGDLDLLGTTGDLAANPPHPSIVVWRNTGSKSAPRFDEPPSSIPNSLPGTLPLPTIVSRKPLLLTPFMGSWLRRFSIHKNNTRTRLRDDGLFLARGQPVSSGGYNSTEVADWDADGDLDLICGNEKGFLHLIENVSTAERTIFASPRLIRLADGAPMHVARWMFIDDHDPEWNLGQSKPTYVDWDLDGDHDLLVGNNANRVAYFENVGSRSEPRFERMRKLTYGAGSEHFSFRKRPAVVDWNGDGLHDLVQADHGVREKIDPKGHDIISLFRRTRSKAGVLELGPSEPFYLADGSPLQITIPYRHGFEVADWDGDGDFDIFTNERFMLYVYRNVGSNRKPAFAPRQVLKAYGQPIQVAHHETSIKIIDWDRDGVRDLIAGGESGWVYFFRGQVLDAAAAPQVTVGTVETKSTN
jgi:hypothetical protein